MTHFWVIYRRNRAAAGRFKAIALPPVDCVQQSRLECVPGAPAKAVQAGSVTDDVGWIERMFRGAAEEYAIGRIHFMRDRHEHGAHGGRLTGSDIEDSLLGGVAHGDKSAGHIFHVKEIPDLLAGCGCKRASVQQRIDDGRDDATPVFSWTVHVENTCPRELHACLSGE